MEKIIYLVDKDPAIIDVICLLLTQEGYTPYIAAKPFDLDEVYKVQPLLAIIHHGLDNEGAKICKRLKAGPLTASIPVILSSTSSGLPLIAKDCGADAFICKPFDIDDLINLVNAHVPINR